MKTTLLYRCLSGTGLMLSVLLSPATGHTTPVGSTDLISRSSTGEAGNNYSFDAVMTADGRYQLFTSAASNLVPNDNNNEYDAFVRDTLTGITERVSLAHDGSEANNDCYGTSISDDGRYVVFHSLASNLVAGSQLYADQVYIRDRINGTTQRVSVAPDGSIGNAPSRNGSISGDGRYLAFESSASNLVPNDTNGYPADVFVRDLLTGITERVSVASDGSEANHRSAYASISNDGRWVVFLSTASNLVPNDSNGAMDIFVHDRQTQLTERVSVASDGSQANNRSSGPHISGDGQLVVFTSHATNLVGGDSNGYADIFVHDRQTGITERVSEGSGGVQANDESYSGRLNDDGRYVAFLSYANNLDSNDGSDWYSDIFVHDRVTGITEMVSYTSDGGGLSNYSDSPDISADGRYVSFDSGAIELLPAGATPAVHVYRRDRQ